jgi:hypothetical protein
VLDAAVSDGSPKRDAAIGACALALAAVGVLLLRSLVILPWFQHVNAWVIPLDAWTPVRAARYVGNGDVFHLYEPLAGRTGYPYTPGLPILLAPFVAIGDHFHLLGDVFFAHRHPGMFLIVGPADAFLGTLPVVLAAGLAVDGSRRRRWTVQALVFVVVAWAPVGFLHPEDTIVTGLLIASCLAVEREQWRSVGALAGIALLFKQWAMWPALVCIAVTPRRNRAQTAFYAYAMPALVLAPFLLASRSTSTSLTATLATLRFGQPQRSCSGTATSRTRRCCGSRGAPRVLRSHHARHVGRRAIPRWLRCARSCLPGSWSSPCCSATTWCHRSRSRWCGARATTNASRSVH